MKNKSLILIAAILFAILLAAYFLYPKLSARFSSALPTPPKATNPVGNTNATVPQASDFTVYDIDGNAVQLSDFFGKPIIVNFWTTWCGPCRSELPAFENAYLEYANEVVFLMVNLTDGFRDTESSAKQFVAEQQYTFPLFFDLQYNASNAYGVYSIPETVFIRADGSLYDTRIGALDESMLNSYIIELIGDVK